MPNDVNDVEALVTTGHRALDDGHWLTARDSFQRALVDCEIAEACYGLGEALWWLGDMPGTIANYARAYAAFRHRSDPAHAAGVALCGSASTL